MALDPRAAMLKINQERQDVQKALAASQAEMGKQMSKKGKKGALGGWLGKLAAPVLADWGTTALLNVFAPGLGSLYKAAKGTPLLKAGAKGLLTAYGGAKGAEIGAGSVNVGESEDLMKKYMASTVSGEKGMRFDRGATAAMEEQKDLQLTALDDMMKQDAYTSGLKAAGSSLLGDLKGKTSEGVNERLKSMRDTGGELTTQDYMQAFSESGKDARKQLFNTDALKEWSAKREGLSVGQALKYSDKQLTPPTLPTVSQADMDMIYDNISDLNQPTRIAGEGSRWENRIPIGMEDEQAQMIKDFPSFTEATQSSIPMNMENINVKDPFLKGVQSAEPLEDWREYGAMTDRGPIGSTFYNEAMIEAGGKFGATSESGLLGIPFNQQPDAPSGELKLPGIPTKPLGYDKMMNDIFQSSSLKSPQRPLYGSPITKPTFEQAPSQNLLMQNIFGKNYYDRLRGGNY